MNFLKAILITFLTIVILDKLCSYINSNSKEDDVCEPQEVGFSPLTNAITQVENIHIKQIVAKTKEKGVNL